MFLFVFAPVEHPASVYPSSLSEPVRRGTRWSRSCVMCGEKATKALGLAFTLVTHFRTPSISQNLPGAQSFHPRDGQSQEGCPTLQVLLSSISPPQKRVHSICEGREKCEGCLPVSGGFWFCCMSRVLGGSNLATELTGSCIYRAHA